MPIDRACDADTPKLSTTRTVNPEFPIADGVPLISPVSAVRFSPAGNDPLMRDHFSGAVPPDTTMF